MSTTAMPYELPWPLFRRLAELGLVGEDIEGYGCPAMSPLARGLVHMEVNRGDGRPARPTRSRHLPRHPGRLAMKRDRPAGLRGAGAALAAGDGARREPWAATGFCWRTHVIRHMGDIEVIHTFEGTETMQALIVGRDIIGVGAFT